MFGKLEDAMMTLFNDDNMPNSYEVRLWEDYCCINSLSRCCSDCTFTNSFETLCISWINGAISLHYLQSARVSPLSRWLHTPEDWSRAQLPSPAMAPFPRRKWVYYTWAGGRWDLARSWSSGSVRGLFNALLDNVANGNLHAWEFTRLPMYKKNYI